MQKKTLLFNALSAAVLLLTSYSGFVPAMAAAWMGIIVFAITAFLNTAYTQSGVFIAEGWRWAQWTAAGVGILISVLNLTGEQALIPQNIVNGVVIGLTIFIQFIGKQFPVNR